MANNVKQLSAPKPVGRPKKKPGPIYAPPEKFYSPLAQMIYEYISAEKTNLSEFAEAAGISRATLYQLVEGHHAPYPEVVIKIAHVLGLDPGIAFLLSRSEVVASVGKAGQNHERWRQVLPKLDLSDVQRKYFDKMLTGSPEPFQNGDVRLREFLNTVNSLLMMLRSEPSLADKNAMLTSTMVRLSEVLTTLDQFITPNFATDEYMNEG